MNLQTWVKEGKRKPHIRNLFGVPHHLLLRLCQRGSSVFTDLLWKNVWIFFAHHANMRTTKVFEQDGMPWFCLALSCVCWSRWGRLGPLFLLHLITLRHSYTEQLVQSAECFWALLGGGNINPCSITRPNIIPRSVINISTLLPSSLRNEEQAKCF